MRCIYFDGTNCHAVPPAMSLIYKPTEQDKKDFCESNQFRQCERHKSFVEYAQAIHGVKQK